MNLLERFLIMTGIKPPTTKEERDDIYVRMRTAGYLTEDELKEMVKEDFKYVI
tara:strand:- start:33437 stop:33595 length:159 start_codon:yes stop_codon:yes gene_type:complete